MAEFVILNDINLYNSHFKTGDILDDTQHPVDDLRTAGVGLFPFVEATMGDVVRKFKILRDGDMRIPSSLLFENLFLVTRLQAQMNLSTDVPLTLVQNVWSKVAPWDVPGLLFNADLDLPDGSVTVHGFSATTLICTIVLNGANGTDCEIGLFEDDLLIVALEFQLLGNGRPVPVTLNYSFLTFPDKKYDIRVKQTSSTGDVDSDVTGGSFTLAS